MHQTAQKRLFSAIQPSGAITIGNYIGAIQNWAALQQQNDCIFAIADLHAITVQQIPEILRKNSRDLVALLLACGVDCKNSILFLQSQLSYHIELMWLLSSMCYIGELSRMTQFKDKSAKKEENCNAGLMTYPVLMAADILLYQTEIVPVGADQKQHLELARNLALRFNNRYSQTFTLPEPYITSNGQAKIFSLQEPTKKMSKSDVNSLSYITLLDKKEEIIKKCKRAVTDSDNQIYFDCQNKAGISNLLTIYSAFTGKSIAEAEMQFKGVGYANFKETVGEAVAKYLAPIQERYRELVADKRYIDTVLRDGRERAGDIAYKTLRKVYKKIGFYRGE